MVSTQSMLKTIEDELTYLEYNRLLKSMAPSARVYREDDLYFAMRVAENLATLYSDGNFKDLMNQLISDMYDDAVVAGQGFAGKIQIAPQLYISDGTINQRAGIHIWGENRKSGDPTEILGTIIKATTDNPIFSFDYPVGASPYHTGLHSMWLEGDSKITTKGVVELKCTNQILGDVFLDDLSIVNAKHGVLISNAHATNRIWNVFLKRCFIELCTEAAVKIESSTNQRIFQIRLNGCHFYDNNKTGGNGAVEISGSKTRGGFVGGQTTFELENRHSIYFAGAAWGWKLGDVIIIDGGEGTTNTYSGVRITGACKHINTGGVIAMNNANNKMKYGYEADNDCDYLTCIGNNFKGQSGGASYGTGANNKGADPENAVETG